MMEYMEADTMEEALMAEVLGRADQHMQDSGDQEQEQDRVRVLVQAPAQATAALEVRVAVVLVLLVVAAWADLGEQDQAFARARFTSHRGRCTPGTGI